MTQLVLVRCGKCDCEFGLTSTMQQSRQKDGETFYCPNGHPRAYCDTEADKLRRERDQLQQRIAEKDDEITHLEARRRAAVGQVTKLRNRVGNGVCPCCTRSFTNLRRHMETEHPEFRAEAAE